MPSSESQISPNDNYSSGIELKHLALQRNFGSHFGVGRIECVFPCKKGDPNMAYPWWQTGVIYQVYPRSFMDANNDGIGDLPGVLQKLDYLVDLGIQAIWLSPFYPSPMADFGYDVKDYCDVDPLFGTLADYDQLLMAAHQRGLKIIIDFVPNHSSDQHPWFTESRSSQDNPKRDWYTWRDGKPGGLPPNNWLSVFGGPAWTLDPHTGQYYLHSFLKDQPDLNWRNPDVQKEMMNAVRFWLERGTDGIRIDVAHFIIKDPDLRDNPPNPAYGAGNPYKPFGEYDSILHIHDKGHPDIHAVYREFRAMMNEYDVISPRMSVGETHIFDWHEWASYYGQNLDELHMPFNFSLLFAPWDVPTIQKLIADMEAVIPAGGWPNFVMSNHDEHRLPSRLGTARARVAMLMLLTLRGTPQIYYGDEIGMVDVEIPPGKEQDPWGKQVKGLGLGRDPERTPMQWDSTANAGFSAAGVETWLPIAPDYRVRNAMAQSSDPQSMLSFTRALLKLRASEVALNHGTYEVIAGLPETVFGYQRTPDADVTGKRYQILLNFSDQPITVTLPNRGQIVLNTHADRAGESVTESVNLRGDEGVVIQVSE
jgi:alpha-glucosidase